MRYLYITLLLLGLLKNVSAGDAEPVQIPGYTPPNITPNATPKAQQRAPSSAPMNTQQSSASSAPLNTQQSTPSSAPLNTQQRSVPSSPLSSQSSASASASLQVKQMTANFLNAIRQCQPQNFDLTKILANLPSNSSGKTFPKMFGNFTFNISILGYSGSNCHILTTMSAQGLIPNSSPATTSMDCLITPSLMTDLTALSQLIMRDNQAGKPLQPDTKQLFAKWMPEYLKMCTITFNGKQMTMPPEFYNPATYTPSSTAPNAKQPAPQQPTSQSEPTGQ